MRARLREYSTWCSLMANFDILKKTKQINEFRRFYDVGVFCCNAQNQMPPAPNSVFDTERIQRKLVEISFNHFNIANREIHQITLFFFSSAFISSLKSCTTCQWNVHERVRSSHSKCNSHATIKQRENYSVDGGMVEWWNGREMKSENNLPARMRTRSLCVCVCEWAYGFCMYVFIIYQ